MLRELNDYLHEKFYVRKGGHEIFCTNIHEKLKIGDIGSIFSVRNPENGIKALILL